MTHCTHSFEVKGTPFATRFVIDDWQGPTDAILQCTHCGGYAILQLVHWHGPNLCQRVYAGSPLPQAATLVFLKDMNTDYCDLARHRAEVDALLATKGPTESVIGVDLELRTVIASGTPDLLLGKKVRSWRIEPPDESDTRFLEFTRTS